MRHVSGEVEEDGDGGTDEGNVPKGLAVTVTVTVVVIVTSLSFSLPIALLPIEK